MSDSTNLQLSYLDGAQAQKHVSVNESLRRLDALVLLAVEDKDLSAPPGSPSDGARYIPAATATGLWSGKENHVAHYVDGAWEFYVSRQGFLAYVRDEDLLYVYTGTAWTTLDHALSVGAYTVATVPSAGARTGRVIYVSDESGGAVPAFSDGTNWRRVTDRAVIS